MKTVAELLAARYGLLFAGHNVDLLERGLVRLADSLGLSLEVLCCAVGSRRMTPRPSCGSG